MHSISASTGSQATNGVNRSEHISAVRELANKFNLPIAVFQDNEVVISVTVFIRQSHDCQSQTNPLSGFDVIVPFIQRFTHNPTVLDTMMINARNRVIRTEPFRSIHAQLTLQPQDVIARYMTPNCAYAIIPEDKVKNISETNHLPPPKMTEGNTVNLEISMVVKPAKQNPNPNLALAPPAPQNQPKPTTSKQGETNDKNKLDEFCYQVPKANDRNNYYPLITQNNENNKTTLIQSLNIYTTKIVKTPDGRIHVFEPRLKNQKKAPTIQPIDSQTNDNIEWVKTHEEGIEIAIQSKEDIDRITVKVSDPSKRKKRKTRLRKSKVPVTPAPEDEEEPFDSDDSSSDSCVTDSDSDEDSDKAISDTDDDEDRIEHMDEDLSKFYSVYENGTDAGSENIFQEAIATYQLSFPKWKQETIEYIKLLPMNDAYRLLVRDSHKFPSDKVMVKRIINLMKHSCAFYRLYTEDQLKKMGPTQRSHIFIAQLATHHQQITTINMLDQFTLVRIAVNNYMKFFPSSKVSTCERIRHLPYNRLIQLFFMNKFPSRSQVIFYIRGLMGCEDRSMDYINVLFRAPGYLDSLPTETLHRIFFIKLTFERDYKLLLESNDPTDEKLIKANKFYARTTNQSSLKSTRPLQSIFPPKEDGDEIPEPPEAFIVQAPESIRQEIIDERRRAEFLSAIEMTEEEWKDFQENANNDESMYHIQNTLFMNKWPNYNVVMNYFRPTTPQDFSPAVINQLDCVPPPFKFLPKLVDLDSNLEPNPIPQGEVVPMTKEDRRMILRLNAARLNDDERDELTQMEQLPQPPPPTITPTTSTTSTGKVRYDFQKETESTDKDRVYLKPFNEAARKLVELNKTICLNNAQGPRRPPQMIYLQKHSEDSNKTPAQKSSNARPATPATPTRKRILSDPSDEANQADAKRTSDDAQSM